jgi:hypothetical protein
VDDAQASLATTIGEMTSMIWVTPFGNILVRNIFRFRVTYHSSQTEQ